LDIYVEVEAFWLQELLMVKFHVVEGKLPPESRWR